MNNDIVDTFRYMITAIRETNRILNKIDKSRKQKEENMVKFKDVIFEKNVVIHCPEEWMANNLLEYADSKGYRWTTGSSYLKSNSWNIYRRKQCYYLNKGRHCNYDYYEENNYKILHYDDVFIKGESMKTPLDYKLMIKGKEAKIGSNLLMLDRGEYYNVELIKISFNRSMFSLIFYNDVLDKFINVYNLDNLFWEKPIIYQLPDTEGNLSEVKVGQPVWVKYVDDIGLESPNKIGDVNSFEITNLDNKIYAHWGINNTTGAIYYGDSVFAYATTNKPKRDFSDCMDWSHAPDDCEYWGIGRNGTSKFFNKKPTRSALSWNVPCGTGWEHAGYRADLLNENGIVEDWEYSLVERPEEV